MCVECGVKVSNGVVRYSQQQYGRTSAWLVRENREVISNGNQNFTYRRFTYREFPGPEENGENVRFKDICKCLDALVAGAKEQKPDIAVIAGDIFIRPELERQGIERAADGGTLPA